MVAGSRPRHRVRSWERSELSQGVLTAGLTRGDKAVLTLHPAPDVHGALADFFQEFNPDLEQPDFDEIPEPYELRLRTAPWGDVVGEPDEDGHSADSSAEDDDNDLDQSSNDGDATSQPSSTDLTTDSEDDADWDASFPRPNPRIRDVLHPIVPPERLWRYRSVAVPLATPVPMGEDPLGLRVTKLLRDGAQLPRPLDAPRVFRRTQEGPLMDQVVDDLLQHGLLRPGRPTCAFPLFLVPKANGYTRVIHDLSQWTSYYTKPRFKLYGAAQAIRSVPKDAFLVKLDLKSGFYQLPLAPQHQHFYGVRYKHKSYLFTRLPMGHCLAPALMQQWGEAVARLITQQFPLVRVITYLDDWLIYGMTIPVADILTFLDFICGITLNMDKCILNPTHQLTYLGFTIDTQAQTIQATPEVIARLRVYAAQFASLSSKDLERVAGYVSWVAFNLHWPMVLPATVLRRQGQWLRGFLRQSAPELPRCLRPPVNPVIVYVDATPHSVAAFCPQYNEGWAQAFERPTTINIAEMAANLMGAQWALTGSSIPQDRDVIIYTDSQVAFWGLSNLNSVILHNIPLFMTCMFNLYNSLIKRYCAWRWVPSDANLADGPSRDVLHTLHHRAGLI